MDLNIGFTHKSLTHTSASTTSSPRKRSTSVRPFLSLKKKKKDFLRTLLSCSEPLWVLKVSVCFLRTAESFPVDFCLGHWWKPSHMATTSPKVENILQKWTSGDELRGQLLSLPWGPGIVRGWEEWLELLGSRGLLSLGKFHKMQSACFAY